MRDLKTTLTVLLAALVVGAAASGAAAQSIARGRKVPNFTAEDALTGEKFALEDFRGKVVIVDFWATWCGPCVKELPNVKAVYRKYKDKGLVIVSISLDRTRDRGKFESFVKRQKMDWYHVMEGGQWQTRLARKYGIRSIPAMYVLDHEGVCVAVKPRGRLLGEAVKKAIAELPAGAGAPAGSEPRGAAGPTRPATGLDEEIRAARNAVQAAGATLKALPTKLDAAEESIGTLDEELPRPRRPEVARLRYERLCRDLAEVRRELFVMGQLDGRPVALPENLFDGDEVELDRALVAAKGQLEIAREAAAQMRVIVMRLGSEIDRLERDLRQIERRRGRDGGATRPCDEVRKEAEALRDAWMEHLRRCDDVMAELTADSPSAGGPADGIAERIASCRERLSAARRDASVEERLRADFSSVCADLSALCDDLVNVGAIDAGSIELPSNPFQRGSMRDVRNRIEAERQLDKADAALEKISQVRKGMGGRFAGLSEQLDEMQAELDRAADEAARLGELEKRFRQWCERFLAVLDGAEGEPS